MKLLRWRLVSTQETLDRLYRTKLKGFGNPLIYASSYLQLKESVPTDLLIPAQRYVLNENIETILELRKQFDRQGINIFRLDGAIFFYIERNGVVEGPIPLLPPIVEEARDAQGQTFWLINDGMHRVSAARRCNSPINIILAENVPTEYPYYAKPLTNGWSGVEELEFIPEGFVKKEYTDPVNYKSLFRDFNEVFSGIQTSRASVPVT